MNRRISVTFCCAVLLIASSGGKLHAACEFALQGEGRVSDVIDMRTFRLDDGREVRLAAIEPAGDRGREALASLIDGRDVTLHGPDDRPDRYGRQPAFAFLKGSEISIQSELLTRGEALVSPAAADKACSAALLAAEATARAASRGIWASSVALKNAESTDDILAGIGRFAVVEGTVSSARLAGAVFYVNFGRRWTQDFAVTISRRIIPSLESAGVDLKSLKNKRVRVRGWIEKRGGPRIEVTHAGQIELIAAADIAVKGTMPRDEGK
ncbi:MAG: thermonuclease family protein [Pseudomonadota bacterium]|nr:thermonuclease family protein [Afipia sp.]